MLKTLGLSTLPKSNELGILLPRSLGLRHHLSPTASIFFRCCCHSFFETLQTLICHPRETREFLNGFNPLLNQFLPNPTSSNERHPTERTVSHPRNQLTVGRCHFAQEARSWPLETVESTCHPHPTCRPTPNLDVWPAERGNFIFRTGNGGRTSEFMGPSYPRYSTLSKFSAKKTFFQTGRFKV